MSNRNPRDLQILSQIPDSNPFKRTLVPALSNISRGFAKSMEDVRLSRKSPEWKQDEARGHLRKALGTRQDRLKPFDEFRARTAAMSAQVRLPEYDRTDDYAARLRAEMRDKSYDMTPLERIGLLTGPNRIVYFDAISEQPLFMSGLREKSELDVYAALKEERLREHCGPLQDAIAVRKGTESEILMVDNMVFNDLRDDCGLSREDFEAETKAFESKAAAPTPEDRTKPAPALDEESWRRFDERLDELVGGSAA
jgi:hypothetical protein